MNIKVKMSKLGALMELRDKSHLLVRLEVFLCMGRKGRRLQVIDEIKIVYV